MYRLFLLASLAVLLFPETPLPPHDRITTTVFFNREVVRIFQKKCLMCHNEKSVSMPLTTYEFARPWARAIREEVLARHIPPWRAVQGYGEFANDISLSPYESELLLSWADGGAPKGDMLVAAPKASVAPKPSLTVKMEKPESIASGSAVQVKQFTLPVRATREQSLRAIEFRPGDARVVRAAFLYLNDRDHWLGGWTPWQTRIAFPSAAGLTITPQSQLILDVVYSGADGEGVQDTSQVLLFTDAVKRARVIKSTTFSTETDIPLAARALALRVESSTETPVEVKVIRPDGSSDVLLWLKNLDPNWPSAYVFDSPVLLEKGSKLKVYSRNPVKVTLNTM